MARHALAAKSFRVRVPLVPKQPAGHPFQILFLPGLHFLPSLSQTLQSFNCFALLSSSLSSPHSSLPSFCSSFHIPPIHTKWLPTLRWRRLPPLLLPSSPASSCTPDSPSLVLSAAPSPTVLSPLSMCKSDHVAVCRFVDLSLSIAPCSDRVCDSIVVPSRPPYPEARC